MKLVDIFSSNDYCTVCGQTPCNCTSITESYDDDEDCDLCNGTGEGLYDGESCPKCHGTGVLPHQHSDDDFDVPDDDFGDYDEPESHYEKYVRTRGLEEAGDKPIDYDWYRKQQERQTRAKQKQGMAEGGQTSGEDYRDPPEADYGDEYQDMVARVKKLAGLGPLKTVWDPQKRVYKNVPTAEQPKK